MDTQRLAAEAVIGLTVVPGVRDHLVEGHHRRGVSRQRDEIGKNRPLVLDEHVAPKTFAGLPT